MDEFEWVYSRFAILGCGLRWEANCWVIEVVLGSFMRGYRDWRFVWGCGNMEGREVRYFLLQIDILY